MKSVFEGLASPFLDQAGGPIGPRVADPGQGARLDRLVGESPFVQGWSARAHEDECGCGGQRAEAEEEGGLGDEGAEQADFEAEADFGAGYEYDSPPAEPPRWTGTAEQLDFRRRVLAEHIARSQRRSGAAKPDLPGTSLTPIAGTNISTLPDTAAAAGRLLEAANAALAQAKQTGHADAQRTRNITVSSGYRGSEHQRDLWLGYFSALDGYYDQTRTARSRIAGGPHSEAAVAYMLRRRGDGGFGVGGRIAAPGYSNHQGGIAIDFLQERDRGHAVRNKSSNAARARWRATWFHGWLREHAAGYGFEPIATEEWHWEFRGKAASGGTAGVFGSALALFKTGGTGAAGAGAGAPGGKLWKFASATSGGNVAVYASAAALKAGEVKLLVHIHGHLSPCGVPQPLPEGLITESPFKFDRLIDNSGEPWVLLVPHLDWTNPGGAAVFGAGHPKWHALAEPSRFNAFVDEWRADWKARLGGKTPTLGRLVVSGHSRAYDFLEPLAESRNDAQMSQGALAVLSDIWAFDTTYAGRIDRWTDWAKAKPALRLVFFYRPGTDTAAVGDAFFGRRGGNFEVYRVGEGHCAVPARRLPPLLKPPPPKPALGKESAEFEFEFEEQDETDPDARFEAGGWSEGRSALELDDVEALEVLDPESGQADEIDRADEAAQAETFEDPDEAR